MGKNNRKRRADKRRERARRSGPHQPRPSAGLGVREVVEKLIFDAAESAEHGDEDGLVALRHLASVDGSIAATVMTGCLIAELRAAWQAGWQPADVARAAAKRLGRAHAEVVGQLIRVEARASAGPGVAVPESWALQLEQLTTTGVDPTWGDLDALRVGTALLGMLTHMPDLPRLMPPPSEWGPGRTVRLPSSGPVDNRMLTKVRALLAKAESTDFEEEAGALTAKAQELMARHAIDHAMVTGRDDSDPCGRRIGIDDPYALGKANLLAAVAGANRCRAVWMDRYGFSTVFGFPGDLDIVDLLYTSLLVQANRAMTVAGSVRDQAGKITHAVVPPVVPPRVLGTNW